MKPKLFHRCGIHIPVKNLRETLKYYQEKLGFTEEWIWGEKDGGLQRDKMRLLFGEDPVYTGILNNNNNRLNLIWFVENVDEIYKEFQERKIEIASELKDYAYGIREFAFVDINGYYIRIAEGNEDQKNRRTEEQRTEE